MRLFPTEESRYVSAMYYYYTDEKWSTAFCFLERRIITQEDDFFFFPEQFANVYLVILIYHLSLRKVNEGTLQK